RNRIPLLLLLFAALAAVPRVAFAGEPPSRSRAHHALHGTVNLNSAEPEALELLPGIGEAKAARIVTWRHTHPFKKVEDLTRVKGIGKKTRAKLKPYLSVTGQTTLSDDPAPTP